MAPAVLMSAAATAALISTCANYITLGAGAAATAGTVGWTAVSYFRKVPCPSCTTMVRLSDYIDHAKGHTFQCPSCQEHVAFSDLERHAQRHGFSCPACFVEVPLADLSTHLDGHRRENEENRFKDLEERAKQDEDYAERVRELSREYEQRMLKIQRAEADFNEAKEQAKLLWAHLKVECYICKRTVCIAEIESHVAQHRLGLKPSSMRQDELASIKGNTGMKSRDSKVKALLKRWGGRQ